MKSNAPSFVACTAVSMLPWPEIDDLRPLRFLLQAAQQLDTVDFRHPHVEQHELGTFAAHEVQRVSPILGLDHAQASSFSTPRSDARISPSSSTTSTVGIATSSQSLPEYPHAPTAARRRSG